MKKSEVKIGGIYSNGKGRIRKVVDIGPQYKLYDEQECLENLRYEIVHDGSKNNCTAGQRREFSQNLTLGRIHPSKGLFLLLEICDGTDR